jgi:hypothetical protein
VLGKRARIDLIWTGDKWYIMCIEIIIQIIIVGCNTIRMKNDGGLWGNYSWVLIQPTFLKLYYHCV